MIKKLNEKYWNPENGDTRIKKRSERFVSYVKAEENKKSQSFL